MSSCVCLGISEEARDLIRKLLSLDPARRPNLNQILQHKFMAGHLIPKVLPISTLICPPSESFVNQYSNNLVYLDKSKFDSLLTSQTGIHSNTSHSMKKIHAEKIAPKENVFGVWVKNWIVCSDNYGFGYAMTNGCSGVIYNDGSKIILHSNKQ